jgi:hypothetical protein
LAYSPSDSPTAARAKRRGGRGFYRDRDRPYHDAPRPGPRHQSRDRLRQPGEREACELGRELAALAVRFERFRGPLNKWRHQVLVQARSDDWKHSEVLDCLGPVPMSIEEIIEETDLDRQSVEQSLAHHEKRDEAVKCNRNGGPVVIRSDGKATEKVYWRRADRRPSTVDRQ